MNITITSRMAIWSLADEPNNKWTRQADFQLLNNDYNSKWSLISIVGKDEEHLTSSQIKILQSKGMEDILQLRFDDLDGDIFEKILKKYKERGDDIDREKFIWFNDDHAESVIEFVGRHKNDNHLIVHCHAGVSRSSGISLYAAYISGIPVETIFEKHPNIQPNKHVIRKLFDVSEVGYDKFLEYFYSIEHPDFPINYRINN